MNQLKFKPQLIFTTILLLVFCAFSCKNTLTQKTEKSESDEYYVAAYIWPSCHHDERFGDMLWPEGSGEWEIIKKGTPRFEGHYQPKEPLWDYEHDDDPEVMEKVFFSILQTCKYQP